MDGVTFVEGIIIGLTGAGVVVWILCATAWVAAQRDRRRDQR